STIPAGRQAKTLTNAAGACGGLSRAVQYGIGASIRGVPGTGGGGVSAAQTFSLITVNASGEVFFSRGYPTRYLADQARHLARYDCTMEEDAERIEKARLRRAEAEAIRGQREA